MQVWTPSARSGLRAQDKSDSTVNHSNKKRPVAMQSIKVSKRDDVEKFLQKQKRRQGVAKKSMTASSPFVDMPTLLTPAATLALSNWAWTTNDINEEGYPGSHLNHNEILCEHCQEYLNCDERISSSLADLHYLVKHVHADTKYNMSKTE